MLPTTPEPMENYNEPGCLGCDRREDPGCCTRFFCSSCIVLNHDGAHCDSIIGIVAWLTLFTTWTGIIPTLFFFYVLCAWEPKYQRQKKGLIGAPVQVVFQPAYGTTNAPPV